MKSVAFLIAVAASAVAEEVTVTPIQKVLTLMTGMLETAKKEKHEEEVAFAAYNQMVEDTVAEKTRLIAEYFFLLHFSFKSWNLQGHVVFRDLKQNI